MEHPEMVKVKTWSCWSGTEKQVKVKRRGGKLKTVGNVCIKQGVGSDQEAGRGESEHCVSKLLSAGIKLFSITKCALCTYVSILLCQQHNSKLCILRLTHCKYTQGLKDARQITSGERKVFSKKKKL